MADPLLRRPERRSCDGCDRNLNDGEAFWEITYVRRVLNGPPSKYAAVVRLCEACDREQAEAQAGCACVGTSDQEECPHA